MSINQPPEMSLIDIRDYEVAPDIYRKLIMRIDNQIHEFIITPDNFLNMCRVFAESLGYELKSVFFSGEEK
jgi:hypothetical protein